MGHMHIPRKRIMMVAMGLRARVGVRTRRRIWTDNTVNVKFVSVQYLFKVKTIAEADSMVEALERDCDGSGTN